LKLRANEAGGTDELTSFYGKELLVNRVSSDVLAGTVESLLEHLLNGDQMSLNKFVDDFLLTFRGFTTWEVVWDTLEDYYNTYCAADANMKQNFIFVARIKAIKRREKRAVIDDDYDAAQMLKVQREQLQSEMDAFMGVSGQGNGLADDRFTVKFQAEQGMLSTAQNRAIGGRSCFFSHYFFHPPRRGYEERKNAAAHHYSSEEMA
jgi:RasGEF N-terminal motif